MDPRIEPILELIDPPAGQTPWHGGPSLMGTLRGVHAAQAAWKPAPKRHSIWELAVHTAYWDYAVLRYLNPETLKGFGRSPANWAEITDLSEQAWQADKELISQTRLNLLNAIRSFPAARLDEQCKAKKKWTYIQLIQGVAAHETYHIGQIQLMKRLYAEMHG